MPCTPCLSTSSAMRKASSIEVFFSQFCSNLSLGTTTRESTYLFKKPMPSSACFFLLAPSKEKGFVTTPTVSIPISLAVLAMMGAAPVPVPPPIPAVTKIISAPSMMADISSRVSSAARCPTSGLAPAPSPLVSFSPICIFVSARHLFKACLSVLTAINSTPCGSPHCIRRLPRR